MSAMLKKHQLAQIDGFNLSLVEKNTKEVIGKFAQINSLEKALEIQEDDPELISLAAKMSKNAQDARKVLDEGNK